MDTHTTSSSEAPSPNVLQPPSSAIEIGYPLASPAADGPLAAYAIKLEDHHPAPNSVMQPPPPKSDKPRPHICAECQRPFARLEHLKRHERSHTKEKPFECDYCQRAFARRDLLLRHQQKLHNAGTQTTRSRLQRRGSDNLVGAGGPSAASNRIRKNSTSGATGALARTRPRANTISSLDITSLMLGDNTVPGPHLQAAFPQGCLAQRHDDLAQQHRRSEGAIPASHSMHHAMVTSNLPKLRTQSYDHNTGNTNSLRTAPAAFFHTPFRAPMQSTPPHTAGANNTVNPAELHFPTFDSPVTPADDVSLFGAPSNLSSEMPWESFFNNGDGPIYNDSAIEESPFPAQFVPDQSAAAAELGPTATLPNWLIEGTAAGQGNPNLAEFEIFGNPAFSGIPSLATGNAMMSNFLDSAPFANMTGVNSPRLMNQQPPHQAQPQQCAYNAANSYISPSRMANTTSADTPPGPFHMSMDDDGLQGSTIAAPPGGNLEFATRQHLLNSHSFDAGQRVM